MSASISDHSTDFILSPSVCQEIDEWLKKFPSDRKRSAVVPALLKAQEQNGGWLNVSVMNAVAHYLELAPIEVFEVASFYDMYELKPVGRHKISICTNIACMLRGAEELLTYAEKRLGISAGETTTDGSISLRAVECLAACAGAPMCQVNNKQYYENLTTDQLEKIIDDLQQEVK